MTDAERRQRDALQRRHDEARDRGRRFCLATPPGDAHNQVGAIPATAVAAPDPRELADAYTAGRKAKQGQGAVFFPHRPGSLLIQEWEKGWDEAVREPPLP